MHRRKRNRWPLCSRKEFPAACIPALWRRPRNLRFAAHDAITEPAAGHTGTRARSTGTQPRNPVAATSGEGAHRIASLGASVTPGASGARHSQLLARRSDEWEAQGKELLPNIEETPASQALKIGIGAAAGAILVLAIVAGVPSLRTRVLATTNAKSTAAPLEAGMREFQVEVADVNNRRWILKGGGEAGSPFVDTSSRRNAQPPAAPAKKNAVKSRAR